MRVKSWPVKNIQKPGRWLWGAVVAVILVGGGATVGIVRSQNRAINIERFTAVAVQEDLAVAIAASGTVTPIQSVNISPKSAGRIARVFVEQGDRVTAGQRLAQMETSDLQAELLRAQANLSQAQARLAEVTAGPRNEEIAQAQARLDQARARLAAAGSGRPEEISQAQAQVSASASRLDLARARLERNRNLQSQGVISLDMLNQSEAEFRDAEANLLVAEQRLNQANSGARTEDAAQLAAAVREAESTVQLLESGSRPEQIAQAQAQVAAAQAQVTAVELQLADATIVAPFDGIITQKYANEGAYVAPTVAAANAASSTSASILAIARGLEIVANVPEADISRISKGQRVEITADAYPGQTFVGRVNLVAPEAVIEQNVTSFQVRITIETGKTELRSRMNVDVNFLGEKIQQAVVVPTVAIVTQKGQTGVLIPGSDNKPQFRPVKIGQTSLDKTQIISGLEANERVFTSLPPGFKREDIR